MCGSKMKSADLCCGCVKSNKSTEDSYGLKLLGLLYDIHGNMGQSVRTCCSESEQKCPVCQYPLENFKKTGQLGCPECYDHLCQDELTAAIQLSQRGMTHSGKEPGAMANGKMSGSIKNRKIKSKTSENDLSYSV